MRWVFMSSSRRICSPMSGAALAQAFQARGYSVESDRNGYEFQVGYRSDEVYDAIRDAAVETNIPIMYLKRRSLSLEDIYLAGESGEPGPAGPAAQATTQVKEAAR